MSSEQGSEKKSRHLVAVLMFWNQTSRTSNLVKGVHEDSPLAAALIFHICKSYSWPILDIVQSIVIQSCHDMVTCNLVKQIVVNFSLPCKTSKTEFLNVSEIQTQNEVTVTIHRRRY